MARASPNFTFLDMSRRELASLVTAMLQARDAVDRRLWSHPREPTSEAWWADVLADPRARRRERRTDMAVNATTRYRLADEPRAIILIACHKCEWRAAFEGYREGIAPFFDNIDPEETWAGAPRRASAPASIASRCRLRSSAPKAAIGCWIGLRDPHIPENRCSELEDVPDVLSEGRRLDPFSPRHVGHFAEGDLLDLVGELLAFCLIGRAHPVGDELLELRDVRPAEPGAWACAGHPEVDGGIDDVRSQPPREE